MLNFFSAEEDARLPFLILKNTVKSKIEDVARLQTAVAVIANK
jgi:hypothetical protein